jgi:CheY-like chemotaxis protein
MILFVDDEKHYIENTIAEMESIGLKVKFCAGVDEALSSIKSAPGNIQAIVCDVMMPHGEAFTPAETEDNRITGLVFLERLRRNGIHLPVVLLTNLESGRAPVDERAKLYEPCIVIRKRDKWSFEIAETVAEFVRHGRI